MHLRDTGFAHAHEGTDAGDLGGKLALLDERIQLLAKPITPLIVRFRHLRGVDLSEARDARRHRQHVVIEGARVRQPIGVAWTELVHDGRASSEGTEGEAADAADFEDEEAEFETRCATTLEFAELRGVQLAINASAFGPFRPRMGLPMDLWIIVVSVMVASINACLSVSLSNGVAPLSSS